MNKASIFTPEDIFCPAAENGDILAMAFVNIQPFDKVYSAPDAFSAGTLFPDLNKPFLAGGLKK